ncbi:MAG: methyltransferase [Erythrobacter sp.]|nr:methyltransferase [Erythrobacter sp.]
MNDDSRGPLAARFRRLIRETGPISLAHYMGESNAHYYNSRDPLGASTREDAGDFITAPEVSQIFGELIGLWLADSWTRAGRPDPVHYVELGPGRGTLAADALRSAGRFGLKPQVHFVEGSAALRQVQHEAVPGAAHHHDLSSIPDDGALLLVANEFFDALPIRQLVRTSAGWRERMVGIEGDDLVFVSGAQPMDAAVPDEWSDAQEGAVLETCPAAAAIIGEVARRLAAQGGAALVIDYGSRQLQPGETLQALRAHRKLGIFEAPGEADLTAHVDFGTLAAVAQAKGAKLLGIAEQGAWLKALGIDARTEALVRTTPDRAEVLARQRDRLVSDDQMGQLFKVMGLASPAWPPGAGFPA